MHIPDRKRFEQGVIFIILSSLCFSAFSLFIKLGLAQLSIWSLTFLRFFIPFVMVLPIAWWMGALHQIFPLKDLHLQVLRSLSIVIGQFSMTYYLTRASLLEATMLWGTGPLFIPIIASLFYAFKIPRVTWISIAICFAGVAFILKPDRGIFDPFMVFGLISGLSMAVSQTLYGINIEKGNPVENLLFMFFFCSIFTLVPFLVTEKMHFDLKWDKLEVVSVLGIALGTIGNQLLRGSAYQRARPALLTPFLYISVVMSAGLDWMVFKIVPDLWAVFGFFLVLAGSFLKWMWGRGLA